MMALVHAPRITPTRAERIALAVSTAIAGWAVRRMDARSERLTALARRLENDESLRAERDAQRARAYLLGLR
ncbi:MULTISPECIES: hypothetical protein [unclassified Microbacterium]|uniref:hypothetical protein n=1 Tax=unclassified Microbacterium TaxID=2609290 RepID=UPI00301AEE95